MTQTEFLISGNSIDKYNNYSYVLNREFMMNGTAKSGYDRLVG